VDELAGAPSGSAAFSRAARSLDRIGEREIRTTAEIAARFSERPVRAIRDILVDQAPLARHVREVRELADLFAQLRVAPANSQAGKVVAEIGRRQDALRTLIQTLESDRAALVADNAVLGQEERALFREIQTLRRYALLAERIDDFLEEHISAVATSRPEDARTLQTEIVYAVRQRRRDVLLQLTVASQAYASLRLIEQNNLEVIWALRSAAATTMAAFRTASLAARTIQARQVASAAADELSASGDAWADLMKSLDDVDARRHKTLSQIESAHR
jgi:predicted RNA-binding protein YlqC (UPF0109 family)